MADLVVKNFGPLKDVKVSFQKISVFIGPQGSGKSTLARLYASLSWIEKSLMRGNLKGKELSAAYFNRIRFIAMGFSEHHSINILDQIPEIKSLCGIMPFCSK